MNAFYFYFTFLIFATSIPEYLFTSCSENKAFVNGHNSRRLKIARGQVKDQPAATNMKFMVWDDELAAKAAGWAKQDRHMHNPDTSILSKRFSTGENLYWYYTTNRSYKLDPDAALEAWFNEHTNYTFRPLKNNDFDGSKDYQIGHYTQMVWWDSIYVGCAISQKFEGEWKKFFVVCNYGPSGNYIGETPYKKGARQSSLICGCGNNGYNCDCSRPYGNGC